MANIATKFVPIRGTQAAIDNMEIHNGNFYITTDTGRIYVDTANERILLGNGGVSVHYANVEPTQENTDTGIVIYTLRRSAVEENANLKENDLILNKFDGCFYQVVELDNISVITIRLAVSGSGGGGSGGGSGGGGSYSGVMILKPIGSTTLEVLDTQECVIQYSFSAVDATNDPTGVGDGTLYVNGAKKATFQANQGNNSLNVTDYLEANIVNTVVIEVSGDIGTVNKVTQRKTWTVSLVHLTAVWNYIDNTVNTGNTLQFNWTVQGNHPHQTYIVIDDAYTVTPPAPYENYSFEQHYTINLADYGLTHGAHKAELYATTELNGATVRTNSVFHTILIAESNITLPIVALNYYESTMNQYDTINIPILAYNPAALTDLTLIIRDNGEEVGRFENVENNSVTIWSYTALNAGAHRLLVALENTTAYINIEVQSLAINATGQEIQDYAFKFAANTMLNNETIKNWESNGVHFTFSENFDWVNGGLKQEIDAKGNKRSYFNIKAGDSVTLNYKLFNTLSPARGQVFKCVFKATNCRDYDAEFLNCYDDISNIGLKLRAQNAYYANSLNAISVPYCENSFIEFEYDIWGTQTIYGGHRYIVPWLDGVPTGIKVYDINTIFSQNKDIVIGSDECDIQLYLIKVYERHLTDNEHLANFIADALNAQEMLDRYNRNNILDDNTGDISITKLATANPRLKIHTYEISRMSTTKKDEVTGCTYAQYYGSSLPEVTASNVTIKVQGTSSSKYGEAAFNLDSDFKDGFDLADGTHVAKYSMTEDSIAVNYFNTKVNVASCEAANNALNQRWYNTFQPFICEYRANNAKARDTMDFPYPGILFLKDRNTTTDSEGHTGDNVFKDTYNYINSPYYKMYAICNMGNSKKNKDVFHNKNNPYECCVEVADNQSLPQWMTSVEHVNREDIEAAVEGTPEYQLTQDATVNNTKIYYTFDGENYNTVSTPIDAEIGNYYEFVTPIYGPYFEFRYVPDATKLDHSRAWYDFVNWCAHCDPSPYDPVNHPYGYTGEALAEPETYGAYTFKGYTSSTSNYTPTTQILKGTTISTYAGTYTHDTYQRRMAKMLSECEDHLVMDAVVFHYLMIERHCMIDNVAKNTFWTTEDMQHWSMIKDYDNDTADGNDNEGKLTLTYGLEVLDKLNATKDVFNASPSVWLHFIDGLYNARQSVYQALDSKGAWNAQAYLQMFEDYQSAIPERCWIEDYYRKYIRPLEIYGNEMFLGMLEGGKKTHQRKQFETYQALYMSSEYFGNDCHENSMVCRGESAPGVKIKFSLKMYIDCYIHFDAGQQYLYGDKHQGLRAKRNTLITFNCPVQNTNDATMNFYLASYITELGGLSTCVPKEINIAKAVRLRKFYLGGDEYQKTDDTSLINGHTYYINNNGTFEEVAAGDLDAEELANYYVHVVNHNLQKISLGANAMLETMDLRNLAADTEAIDLSALLALKVLDTTGSSFTGVTIADNAPIVSMTLNAINTLRLKNLYQLQSLVLASYSNLKTLLIDNIDNSAVNSKTIVNNAIALENYYLKNVQWTLDNQADLTTAPAALAILNFLATKNPQKFELDNLVSGSRAESLSGTIDVATGTFSASDVADIYDYYIVDNNTNFPSVDLSFSGNNATLYDVSIYKGDGSLFWTKKTTGAGIDATFLGSGPMGAFNSANVGNYADAQYNYTFNEQWKVYNADSDSTTPIATINGAAPIYNETISTNIKIVPVYTQTAIQYELVFYAPGVDPIYCEATYGTSLADVIETNNIPIPEKDSSNLPLTQIYIFKGYSLVEENGNILNANAYTVNGNIALYAQFEAASVYDNIHPEWFNFTPYSYTDPVDPQYSNADGYKISVKSGITLSGKITIPTYYNNKPVLLLGRLGYDNSSSQYSSVYTPLHPVTHVFFAQEANKPCLVREIESYGFFHTTTLKYIELNSIRRINAYCFVNTALEAVQVDANTKEFNFGNNVAYMGPFAFNAAVARIENATVYLSSTCHTLETQAISYNNFVNCEFIIGDSMSGSILTFEYNNDVNDSNNFGKIVNEISNAWTSVTFYTRLYNPFDFNDINLPSLLGSSMYGYNIYRVI